MQAVAKEVRSSQKGCAMDQIVDRTDLLQRCMNDQAFVTQMLEVFREYAPKTLKLLHDAATAGDWTAARRHAHTLKGSAANISAGALKTRAQETEKAIDSGFTEDAAHLLAAVDAAMNECLKAVDRILADPGSLKQDAC